MRVTMEQFRELCSAPEYANCLAFKPEEDRTAYILWNKLPKDHYLTINGDYMKGFIFVRKLNDCIGEVDASGLLKIEAIP